MEERNVTQVLEGGCRCGACRYTLAVEAAPPVYCCHCRDCQTWSGSAFTQQAVAPAAAIDATGPIVDYAYSNRSGVTSTLHVCGTCHTRLWSTNAARPGIALLRAGTLDVSDTLVPRVHIWVKRKQPWISIPDEVPTFEENAPIAEFGAILTR